MKKLFVIGMLAAVLVNPSCQRLDIPPLNIIQDKDIFGSEQGITSYMARMYSQLPIEDFKYSPVLNFNSFVIGSPSGATGEALSRDMGATTETFGYWSAAYSLIREANYFIATLPSYSSSFTQAQIDQWTGEALFVRSSTYFALVKRYGGVPKVDRLLAGGDQSIDDLTASIEELQIPRASEEEIYDFISADMDRVIDLLPVANSLGRINKNAAIAFKSRMMLFAASIANYNSIELVDGTTRICGIPKNRAKDYYEQSYQAAKQLEGKYSLYERYWSEDKDAQYKNYLNVFLDQGSPENIFVRQYRYPDAVHGYDALGVPKQLEGPGGNYSSETNPTLDFVEMFDGLPKMADGTLRTMDDNGKYLLFDNTLDLFQNAEPRLRATVILPGDEFKGQQIEFRRGIYIGPTTGGISKILPKGSTANYPTDILIGSAAVLQTPYTLPSGRKINPAGASGVFTDLAAHGPGGTITGFSIRKYLDPNKPTAEVVTNRSEQSWIEMRYAEVLLNKAEAAYELSRLGVGGNYVQEALTAINQIRRRAGANPWTKLSDVESIRMERRRELAFENKTWWDLKRWRIIDQEQNARLYRVLMPILEAKTEQYFFDERFDERNSRFTFDPRWYYQEIPNAAIAKSPNLIQNPGY